MPLLLMATHRPAAALLLMALALVLLAPRHGQGTQGVAGTAASLLRTRRAPCDGLAEGDACDDENSLTRGDTCHNGECTGICTGVTYQGTCRASCPDGLVRDGNTCASLQPQCGSNCLECTSQDMCARCTSDKFLEEGECVNECSVKGSDGSPSFTTNQNPYSRECNVAEPSGTAPLSSTVIIGIAAGGGALVLIIIVVVCYICCDKRCSSDFDDYANGQTRFKPTVSPSNDVEMGTFSNNDAFSTAPSSTTVAPTATAREKAQWQQTVRHLKSSKLIEAATSDASPQTEHLIDNMPTATLSKSEASHIFKHLSAMKQDKVLYALLLKDLQQRRDAKAEMWQSTEKYDKLIADLTLVLRMFNQERDNTEFPIDCMDMLNWAKVAWQTALGMVQIQRQGDMIEKSGSGCWRASNAASKQGRCFFWDMAASLPTTHHLLFV